MTAGASDPAANIPSRVQLVLSEKNNRQEQGSNFANPSDIFQPSELGGAGNPPEECGHFTEALERSSQSPFPPRPHPHFSFWLLPHLLAEGGKNKGIVHSGNCRPLCRLSVLALLKFRVVCSGSDKSSIRFLFRASKAHAELDSSTAPFTALGLGEALPPNDLLPRLSSA